MTEATDLRPGRVLVGARTHPGGASLGCRCGATLARFLLRSLAILAVGNASVFGAQYIYILDTSDSMKRYRTELLTEVARDIERAMPSRNAIYAEGDQVHLWTFSLDVQERLSLTVAPGSEEALREQLTRSLNRLAMGGRTSLARPVLRALEQFASPAWGPVFLFIFTDGRDSVSSRELEQILALYNRDFRPVSRLAQLTLVQLGKREVPEETRNLIAALGGGITPSTDGREIKAAVPLVQRPSTIKPVQLAEPKLISVSPNSIRLSHELTPEFVALAPIDFKVAPSNSTLVVGLALETTNLPSGMSMSIAADKLATVGRQAVPFLVRGAQSGHFVAKLRLSASVPVEPQLIQIDLEVLPPEPDRVGFQFFPERMPLVELPANRQWQDLSGAGLSLFYPEARANTLVQLRSEAPEGLEFRALAGGDPAQIIEFRRSVKLAELGRVLSLQIRRASDQLIGESVSAKLSIDLEPGQNVKAEGTNALPLQVRFIAAGEVVVGTTEISLGQLIAGTRAVTRTLTLEVTGEAAGKRVRLVKQGQGLAGIVISPAEFVLKAGPMSVDLEFAGLDAVPTGRIEAALNLVPEAGSVLDVRGSVISVSGSVAAPGSLAAEVENPMVVGQPLVIRARIDAKGASSLTARVRPPDSAQTIEVILSDSGSAQDRDEQPNDGVYSGVFEQTQAFGTYHIAITGAGRTNAGEQVTLNVPVYFKSAADTLSGQIAKRKGEEFLKFNTTIVSDYPGSLTLQADSTGAKAPLSAFASTKTLAPGRNEVELLVGLTPETQPGRYQYQIHLVTDKISGASAKIPISFDVTVLSFFQYLIRLVALTLGLALLAFLAVAAPWSRFKRRPNPPLLELENEPDPAAHQTWR